MREDFNARVDADPYLSWLSPHEWELGASLFGIGFEAPSANAVSGSMSSEHGITLRPFETQGLNALRISPHTVTYEAEMDSLFATLDARS